MVEIGGGGNGHVLKRAGRRTRGEQQERGSDGERNTTDDCDGDIPEKRLVVVEQDTTKSTHRGINGYYTVLEGFVELRLELERKLNGLIGAGAWQLQDLIAVLNVSSC